MTASSTTGTRALLDAATTLSENNFHAAAHRLLDFAGLLDRADVHAFIEIETVPDRDEQPVRGAWIDWAGLGEAIERIGPLGGAQDRLLRLAVSIAHGWPVDLRGALSGLGHAHARAVLDAIAVALDIGGDIEITDTPTYLERRRAEDQALERVLAARGLDADGQPTRTQE